MSKVKEFFKLLAAALVYGLSAGLAQRFLAESSPFISLNGVSSGIALTLLIRGGNKYLPAIFIGAATAFLLAGGIPRAAYSIALVNSLQAYLGARWLASIKSFNRNFYRGSDFFVLSGIGLLVSGLTAFVTVLILLANDLLVPQAALSALWHSWQGGILGIMSITPFLLIWQNPPRNWLEKQRLLETTSFIGLLMISGLAVFLEYFKELLGPVSLGYWMFLFVCWASIRFGIHGVSLVVVMTGFFALLGISRHQGFFAYDMETGTLLNFSLYLTSINCVGMTLVQSIRQRIQVQSSFEKLQNQFFQAVNVFPLPTAFIDEPGNITFLNQAFTKELGYTHQEISTLEEWWATVHPNPAYRQLVRNQWSKQMQLLSQGMPFQPLEVAIACKDGELKTMLLSVSFIEHVAVGPKLISLTDISVRKHMEVDLANHEMRLRLSQECGGIGTWEADLINNTQFWSQSCYTVLGFPAKDKPTWEDFLNFVIAEDRQWVLNAIDAHIHYNVKYEAEFRGLTSYGEIRWFRSAGQVERDALGVPIALRGSVQDITERKEIEEKLKKSEEEFRQLAESMPQIVWITEADGRNIYFNHQWMDYTGLTLEESYGDGWNIPFHDEDKQTAWQAWQHAVQHQATYALECRLRRKDGEFRWWLIRGVPVKDKQGVIVKWFGTCTDIHELKTTEKALRDSEFRWQFALDGSNQGVWDWDLVSNTIFFSKRWKSMLGYGDDDVGDQFDDWSLRAHPDDVPNVLVDLQAHLRGESEFYQNEHRMRNKNGEYLWILDRGTVVSRDAEGRPLRMIGTHNDITMQKSMLNAVRDSENMLRLFLNHNPIIAWVKDGDGRLVYFNRTFEQRFQESLPIWKSNTESESRSQGCALHFTDNLETITRNPVLLESIKESQDESGRMSYWRVFSFPFQNALGSWFIGGLGINETEVIKSQRLLAKNERFLSDTQTVAHIGSWMIDLINNEVVWSKETFNLFNLQEDAGAPVSIDSFLPLIVFEDRCRVKSWISDCIHGHQFGEIEFRSNPKTGLSRWLLGLGELERNQDGRPVCFRGSVQDITERKRMQSELQNSLERLELFVEHAPAAIALFDREMRYIACSRCWRVTFNLLEQNLVGKSHYQVFPEVPERWKHFYQRGLAGEVINSDEDIVIREDNSQQILRWELRPWFEDNGAIGGIVIFTEDLTERKQEQNQLKLLAAALEASANAIMITDARGVIEWVNQGFTAMTGYALSEVENLNYRQFLDITDKPQDFDMMWNMVCDGQVWKGEVNNAHKLGVKFPVEQTLTPVFNEAGRVAHVIAIKHNITKRKAMECALQDSLQQYQSLSNHLESIREEERVRIAREIHDELGGFLTALKIDLSFLCKQIPDDLTECLVKANAMKEDIHHGLKTIKRIINDLRPSVLDHLGLVPAIEWLATNLIERANIDYTLKLPEQSIILNMELNTAIFRMIQETFVNIVRHSGAGHVTLTMKFRHEQLFLHIRDDGCGMDEERVTQSGGFGIQGIRERVRYLGGKLLIKTAPGRGTTFKFCLPYHTVVKENQHD